MHDFPIALSDVFVFLVAAGIVAPFLHRLGLSQVVTFLLVGLIVGPYGVARFAETSPWLGDWVHTVTIANTEPAAVFAEVGVVLLLFLIGLELSPKRLWGMRRLVFGYGGLHVLLSGSLIAATAAAFGASPAESFVLGAALALSSTAIVLQLLTERGQLGSPAGRTAFAALLMQDLAVVPILLFVTLLGGAGDEPVGLALAKAAGAAVIVLGAIMVLGRLAARPFLRVVSASRSTEMFAASVLLLIVATAAATQAAGLSLALGAFLAGLLLAETEYRHDIEVLLSPVKGLFLGLFFLSVGMGLDLAPAIADPAPLLLALAGLLSLKAALGLGLARLFGVRWPAAIESAILLASGGEFAFVILAEALGAGVIAEGRGGFLALVAGVSMALAPFLGALARAIARLVERRAAAGAAPPVTGVHEAADHVIIVGFGRVGRLLSELLAEKGVPFIALDADPDRIADARRGGAAAFVGDASKIELLERLGADRALALAVTMDSPHAAEAVVSGACRVWPGLAIFARATDSAHAMRLMRLGAERVTPETLEAGLDLAQAVLVGAGVGDEAARATVDARRREELDRLTHRTQHAPETDADEAVESTAPTSDLAIDAVDDGVGEDAPEDVPGGAARPGATA